MSAAMMFLLVFAAAWLLVTGATIAHFIRPRGIRRDISLLARAGLVIWFTGVIAAMFAEVRRWPAGQISQMQGLGVRCKLAGFAVLLAAGLARLMRSRLPRELGAGPEPTSSARRTPT